MFHRWATADAERPEAGAQPLHVPGRAQVAVQVVLSFDGLVNWRGTCCWRRVR
ncbi:hypothetical protein [Amycolatopsis plumensis]|uniref:hypothetical protein n=1 Tax=Amycolatopsis plumensis TaxID=236508 RepID=UPI00360EDC5C